MTQLFQPEPEPAGVEKMGQTALGLWLSQMGAAEYEQAFRDEHFDTLDELVEARLTEEDLKEVVSPLKLRKRIYQGLQSMGEGKADDGFHAESPTNLGDPSSPKRTEISTKSEQTLQQFLVALGLGQHLVTLEQAMVDLKSLPLFSDSDYADLNIPKGHAVRIRHALDGKTDEPSAPSVPSVPSSVPAAPAASAVSAPSRSPSSALPDAPFGGGGFDKFEGLSSPSEGIGGKIWGQPVSMGSFSYSRVYCPPSSPPVTVHPYEFRG